MASWSGSSTSRTLVKYSLISFSNAFGHSTNFLSNLAKSDAHWTRLLLLVFARLRRDVMFLCGMFQILVCKGKSRRARSMPIIPHLLTHPAEAGFQEMLTM